MHSQVMDERSRSTSESDAKRPCEDVRLVTLPDGRRLAYTEYGERTGYPLFHCHSHGSSRLEAASFHREAKQAGFRIIAIDRPGIGLSDYHAKPSAESFTQDLLVLSNQLQTPRFGLLASGAGTAYALAIASNCPERVSILLGMSSIFPFFTEQGSRLQRLLRLCAAGVMKASIVLRHWRGAQSQGFYLQRILESLSYADKRIFANPNMLALLENDVREALRQGARGVASDSALQFSALKLNFSELNTPCHFWQGSAEGSNARVCAERFIARLSNARLHEVINRGRYFYLRNVEEIFAQANIHLDRVKKPRIQQLAFNAQQMPQQFQAQAKFANR